MEHSNIEIFINAIVYLLPVLALVWHGAKLTGRLETLEKTVKEKTEKFCRDNKELQQKLEAEESARQANNQVLLNALNEIQKSIIRIETKMDLEDKDKK